MFADSEATIERLKRELTARAEGETFGEAMRRWLAYELAEWRKHSTELAVQRQLIESEPALQAVELRTRARVHAAVADAIAEDFSMRRDALEPQMVAAATIAIFDVIGNRLGDELGRGAPPLDEICSDLPPMPHASSAAIAVAMASSVERAVAATTSAPRNRASSTASTWR